MVGILITDTHLLYSKWSQKGDDYTVSDFQYIKFSEPIKLVLKEKSKIQDILKNALQQISLKKEEVLIGIDDELLFHDKLKYDENFTKKEIWDYIQWETKQKWGELGNFYTTFAEADSHNPKYLHTVAAPTLLVTQIKGIITNLGATPVWSGPVSSIFLDSNLGRNKVYLLDDTSNIKFHYRSRDGYTDGTFKFEAGKPVIIASVGNKDELEEILSYPHELLKFVVADLISNKNNTYLRQYKHEKLIPFENINVDDVDVSEDVPFKLLNVLTILIKEFEYKGLFSFFTTTEIQERKYQGFEKPSKTEVVKETTVESNVSNTKEKRVKKRSKRRKKSIINKPTKSYWPYLLIVLAGIVGWFFLLNTATGKELKSRVFKEIGIENVVSGDVKTSVFEQQFHISSSVVKELSSLLPQLNSDNLVSFKLKDTKGTLELFSPDEIEFSARSSVQTRLDTIEGGVNQYIIFQFPKNIAFSTDVWTSVENFVQQVAKLSTKGELRKSADVTENSIIFTPIIIEVPSHAQLVSIIDLVNRTGDNILLRKISIENRFPEKEYKALIYISAVHPF